MKPLIFFCLAALLTACGPDAETICELEAAFADTGLEKIENAESHYAFCAGEKMEGDLTAEQFAHCTQVHHIAKGFYKRAESARQRLHENENYSLDSLLTFYRAAMDSIALVAGESEAVSTPGYANMSSETKILAVAALTKEVAQAEIDELNRLLDRHQINTVRDDFRRSPTLIPVSVAGSKFSLAVDLKYLQIYQQREIEVTEILRDKKKMDLDANVDHDGILGLINFKTISPGKYTIRGKVSAVAGSKIIELPFEQTFEVK